MDKLPLFQASSKSMSGGQENSKVHSVDKFTNSNRDSHPNNPTNPDFDVHWL